MKILQLTPSPGYPPTRGGQHRFHGLVTSRDPDDEVLRVVHGLVPIQGEGQVTIDDNYHEIRTRSWLQYLNCFLTGRLLAAPPIFASDVLGMIRTPSLDNRIEWADVIMVEYPWMLKYVDEVRVGTPLVYSSHNYEVERYISSSRFDLDTIRSKIERLEGEALRRSDLTLVTSDRDRQKYTSLVPGARITVAPNAIYRDEILEDGLSGGRADRTLTVLFVGSDHPPNRTAVSNIFDIAGSEPVASSEIEFVVVGTVTDGFNTSPSNVELVGYVDDLDAWYRLADLAINPMTSGGGTNVKMVEYFAKGLPVVTTPFGARGIPAEADRHYFQTSVEDMASLIVDLQSRRDETIEVAGRAKRLVREQLNWEKVSEEVMAELRSLIDGGTDRGPVRSGVT